MIKCLLIGHESDIEKYSQSVVQSNYYKSVEGYSIDVKTTSPISFSSFEKFDALLLVSKLVYPFPFLSTCMKEGKNLFFTDQPELTVEELASLEQLNNESGGLIVPEFIELSHPLVEDFITVEPKHLQYSYTKSLVGRKDIRPSLITALGFLSLLSSMPVKKIDVSTIETTSMGRPSIKVRLKMYDSSVCHILLDIDNKNEHDINIETAKGTFHMNLAENYLENIHGSKFFSHEVTDGLLLNRTLDSYAMNIILNTKPLFSFHHYVLVVNLIGKIESILKNSF
jgi:hypothetical protein